MRLTSLSLSNFRNFVRLESEFSSGVTLVVGDNAQGKTSLLEAIHFLTGATNPHTRNDLNLINFLALHEPQPFTRLAAEITQADRRQRIEIRILLESGSSKGEARSKKQVLLNGVKKRLRDLFGVFNAVLFLPQDLRILEGPPSERRRYLDNVLSQADPSYARNLSEYSRVVSQRNALLKQIANNSVRDKQLEFWDDQMVNLGAHLVHQRALALIELQNFAAPYHHDLTRGEETLRMEYMPALATQDLQNGQMGLGLEQPTDWSASSQAEIRRYLLAALEQRRSEEIARGMTLSGPHRDDLSFTANGIDLRLYGSRGQNRTAILAAKLSEVDWLKQRSGEWPVLLLDEVLAELDTARREALLSCLMKVQQALVTTADVDMFDPAFLPRVTTWRVSSGTLTRLES
jgi:DNA replication and repair protein RecF